MAFVSWDTEISNVKDRLSELSASLSKLMTESYDAGVVSSRKRKISELQDYLKFCYEMKNVESAGSVSSRVSYSKPRSFRT